MFFFKLFFNKFKFSIVFLMDSSNLGFLVALIYFIPISKEDIQKASLLIKFF